jgi:hypothetical protein
MRKSEIEQKGSIGDVQRNPRRRRRRRRKNATIWGYIHPTLEVVREKNSQE